MPRIVSKIIEPQAVTEGAGVHLRRSIGTRTLDYLDPFLLLDHFASKNPEDYEAGFPMHPHRGIETVTYLLAGEVQPEGISGFQLWVNLPARLKMTLRDLRDGTFVRPASK